MNIKNLWLLLVCCGGMLSVQGSEEVPAGAGSGGFGGETSESTEWSPERISALLSNLERFSDGGAGDWSFREKGSQSPSDIINATMEYCSGHSIHILMHLIRSDIFNGSDTPSSVVIDVFNLAKDYNLLNSLLLRERRAFLVELIHQVASFQRHRGKHSDLYGKSVVELCFCTVGKEMRDDILCATMMSGSRMCNGTLASFFLRESSVLRPYLLDCIDSAELYKKVFQDDVTWELKSYDLKEGVVDKIKDLEERFGIEEEFRLSFQLAERSQQDATKLASDLSRIGEL